MSDITIKQCTIEDVDTIVELQKEWENEDITYGFSAADKEYLESKLGKYFYIAKNEDEIVGFVYGTVLKAKELAVMNDGELYIEVDDIYLSPDCRGKGIGSLLLDKILEVAKQNGIERSYIYSSTKDIESMLKFYKKHGYKSWYIQMFK